MNETSLRIKDKFIVKGRGLLIVPEIPCVENDISFPSFVENIILSDSGKQRKIFNAKFCLEHFSMQGDNENIYGEIRLVFIVKNASFDDISGSNSLELDSTIWSAIQHKIYKKT